LIKILFKFSSSSLTCSTNKLERLSTVSFSSLAYLMAAPMMKKFFVIFTFDNILLKCSSSLLTHSTNKLEHLILISLSDILAYLLEAPATNKKLGYCWWSSKFEGQILVASLIRKK